MPNLSTIPRTVVRTYLQAARFPLTTAESVLKTDDSWPLTLAYDAVEATVLQRLGDLLNDEELSQQGRLVEAMVAQLRKAAKLEAEAAARRTEAEAEFRDRRNADEAARRRVEAQANERERELAAEKARKQQAADEKARAKAKAAAKVEAVEEKIVTKTEREAKKTRIAAERKALAEERGALAAEQQVIDLDAAIETTKAVRKAR
jgi:hypothetical protein